MPLLRSTLFTLLVAIALMSGACRNGTNPPPLALEIVSIMPAGLVGTPGQEVPFAAMVADSTATTTYAWSVTSGGGTFDNASAAQPILTLGSAATYTVSLTVTDGAATDSEQVSITINATPVVTGVVLDPAAGLPLGIGTATATVVGEYDNVEWDFGGGGETGDSGSLEPGETITDFTFQDPGTYEGQVRVHGSGGWGDWEPFEVEVGTPVAPEWDIIDVGSAWRGESPAVSATIHDGKLVVIYNGTDDGLKRDLRIAHATTDNPTSPSDFRTYVLDPDGWFVGARCILSIEDRLVVVYGRGKNGGPTADMQMRVGVANVEDPESPEDWTLYQLPFSPTFPPGDFGLSLTSRAGGGLVGFWGGGGGGAVIGQSAVTLPDEPEDWALHEVRSPQASLLDVRRPAVTEIDGHLWLSYLYTDPTRASFGVCLLWPTVDPPETNEDWMEVPGLSLEATGYDFTRSDISAWDGAPVVVHAAGQGAGRPLLGQFATVPEPAVDTDFTQVLIGRTGSATSGGVIAIWADRLVVAYEDWSRGTVSIARAAGANPVSPAAWVQTDVEAAGISELTPGRATVVAADDALYVAFVNASGRLRVARTADPY